MRVSLTKFVTWVLQRISYRDRPLHPIPPEDQLGEITFSGNHIHLYFASPIQGEHETVEEFERRWKAWRKRLPRDSTLSMVLALSHEAFVCSGQKDEGAAEMAFGALKQVVGWSAEDKVLYAQVPSQTPMNWIVLKHRIGKSRRSCRNCPKKFVLPDWERNRNTVRTQVSRYKRNHQNFDQLFDTWYSWYLYECGSPEWFRQHEANLRERFERNRLDPATADSFLLASEACGLARMYQLFGRPADALPLYKFALELWKASGAEWPRSQAAAVTRLEEEIHCLSTSSATADATPVTSPPHAPPAPVHEDPRLIQVGLGYEEMVRRFGPPSMSVTTGPGTSTIWYPSPEGNCKVQLEDEKVIAVAVTMSE